jgi:dihydrofolate reductase
VRGISRSPEGASTVNWYLAAGLLGELWLHSLPVTLGAGERLFDGVPPLNRKPLGARANELVTDVRYRVKR